jgi:uncharacterized membrane protein
MLNNPLFLSLIAACCFGGWPFIVRAIGLPPLGVAVFLSAGTLMLVFVAGPMLFPWNTVSGKMIFFGLLSGVINGIAFLAYSKLVAVPQWDISTYVPMVLALTLVISTIGGPLFFNESFSVVKTLGMVSILVGIYLIR